MSETDLNAQLEQLGKAEGDAGASHEVRLAALQRFSELGLPDRRIETWRYTDLGSLAEKGFSYLAPAPDSRALESAGALLGERELAAGAARLVFVDGHLAGPLSVYGESPGLDVGNYDSQPGADPGGTALTALNTAFSQGGTVIRISQDIQEPVELIVIGTGQKLAPQLKLRIELAEDSRATIVQRFIDQPGADEAWLNLVTDIELGSNSELTLYRLQTHENNQYHTTLNRARLAAGAKLTAGNIELGGALVRNEFEIGLEGNAAEADVFSLSLTGDRQHVDTRIAVDHRAPHTTSEQNQRAILADSSRAVFNGKVTVQKQAQHIEARQRSDSLLLSPRAEADTKPELEIYADQVICSHGATVGELSEDHLFYLRARGIDAGTARDILTAAFADTILKRIELESLRDQARRSVSERLPREIESA